MTYAMFSEEYYIERTITFISLYSIYGSLIACFPICRFLPKLLRTKGVRHRVLRAGGYKSNLSAHTHMHETVYLYKR